jgi:hypothetical protein
MPERIPACTAFTFKLVGTREPVPSAALTARRILAMMTTVVAARVMTMMPAVVTARMVTAPVTSKVSAAMTTVAATVATATATAPTAFAQRCACD